MNNEVKLYSKYFVSQYWFWINNCEVINGKYYLTNDAKALFKMLYNGESIPEGEIDAKFIRTFLCDKKHLLNETAMNSYMHNSIYYLNVVNYIYGLEISNQEKNNLVASLNKYNLEQMMILDYIGGNKFNSVGIVNLISEKITLISSATGEKQDEEVDSFLKFANKIYGENFPYDKHQNIVKAAFNIYKGIHTFYAINADTTKNEVLEFFNNNINKLNYIWALRALKTLKISDDKKCLDMNDIIGIIEKTGVYSEADKKATSLFTRFVKVLYYKPEDFYLGNELKDYFSNKYNISELIDSKNEVGPNIYIDLSLYELIEDVKDETKDETEDLEEEIINTDDSIILTDEELASLNKKFDFNTIKVIKYILSNPNKSEAYKEELIISAQGKYVEDFISYINKYIPGFFNGYYASVNESYNELKDIIFKGKDLDEYLVSKVEANNLSLYLRWLKIFSINIKPSYEFSDLLFLIARKKIIILETELFRNELKIISENPDSYLFGNELVQYVEDMYRYSIRTNDEPLSRYVQKRLVYNYRYDYPDDMDLFNDAYNSVSIYLPAKYNLESIIVAVMGFNRYADDNDDYYKLREDDAKALIIRIASTRYGKTDIKDLDVIYSNIRDIGEKDINELITKTHSFDEVIKILDLKFKLRVNLKPISTKDLDKFDRYFRDNNFYSDSNCYSLMKFYEKLKFENDGFYAYRNEFLTYYEDYISKKNGKIDKLGPSIELIQKKEDEDTLGYKIINRVIPTSSEEKKRSITAIISGIGVISLITMTTVFATSPIKAIESCASAFEGLLSNPSLASIKQVIGNPLLYFGAIFESIRGFTKHRFKKAIDIAKEEIEGRHK